MKPRYRAPRLRFTREGKYFVLLTLGIGFAAINTGNNLLYLVLGMLLSLIVGSGVLSELGLLGLSARRRFPRRVYAGRPVLATVTLENTKRRLPSFSVEVQDLLEGRPLDKKCYFLKVPARRSQETSYRHTFPRRGAYTLTELVLGTRFPFALFFKSYRHHAPLELVVYPAVEPLSPEERGAREGDDRLGVRLARRGEFHALREYRTGDDPREIHWRKSARLGRPFVRQHEEPTGQRLIILLDNGVDRAALGAEELEAQERAVVRAASLATHYLERGYAVGLATRTGSVPLGSGPGQLDHLLRALALLAFVPAEAPLTPPSRFSGETILVRPGPPSTARPSAAPRSAAAGGSR